MSVRDVKHVVVLVKGGLVQDVYVPDGVVVEVRDYDTDGADRHLYVDSNHAECFVSEWGPSKFPMDWPTLTKKPEDG